MTVDVLMYSNDFRNIFDRHFQPRKPNLNGILNGLNIIADYRPDDALDGTLFNAGSIRVSVQQKRSEAMHHAPQNCANILPGHCQIFQLVPQPDSKHVECPSCPCCPLLL